jgi:hypothetical protein
MKTENKTTPEKLVGTLMSEPTKSKRRGVQVAATLMLAIAAATAFCSYKWDDWMVKPRLRTGLEQTLKDPASVLYKRELINGDVLCGEFNAKNSFGAYTGFKRFVSGRESHAVEGDSVEGWRHGESETDSHIAHLDIRNEELRRAVASISAGGIRPSEAEIDARVMAASFQRIWERYCKPAS